VNPLDDIRALENNKTISIVIKNGKLIKDIRQQTDQIGV
jgi:hypothetical protein